MKRAKGALMEILRFDEALSAERSLVGGKGANLGVLTQAGFAVPQGFTITTSAYSDVFQKAGLDKTIDQLLIDFNYDDPEQLEVATAKIRDLILAAPLPDALANDIGQAYDRLGRDVYVAVRSSGTAEDLPDASFAGQHDTYLDVKGADALLMAVRQCWASLWTSRATAYRYQKGIEQSGVKMAVVVQTMVASEVSGVMFTAHPLTAATNEIVINASWGLGEAIVQGEVSPDEYIVKTGTLAVIERTLGSKAVRVIRNPETGAGTVTEATASADQERFSLADGQVADLAELGRRVQEHYGGTPQDIEWALADGSFYLLQAREITGVNFSWDCDLEAWQWAPEPDEDLVWSRGYADDLWTGPCSPLMYHWRGRSSTEGIGGIGAPFGFEDEVRVHRLFKFYKGTVYCNPRFPQIILENTWLPKLRSPDNLLLKWLTPDAQQEVLEAPFSYAKYLRMITHLLAAHPEQGPYRWFKESDRFTNSEAWKAELPDITKLDDDELKRLIDKYFDFEIDYSRAVGAGYFVWLRDVMRIFESMMANWYQGTNERAFAELVSGSSVRRTATLEECFGLFELSERIRHSEKLRELFENNPPPPEDGSTWPWALQPTPFFEKCEDTEEGRSFLDYYRRYVEVHGHRGHEDRDLYFARRAEDSAIDYRAIKTLLSADSLDPVSREQEVNRRRDATYLEVLENLKNQPLGFLKVEAFKIAYGYIHKWIAIRDDERWSYERYVFKMKQMFQELGRRLVERELLETERDFFFLTKDELYALSEGRANLGLTRAKIVGRLRDFERVLRRDPSHRPPLYLQRNRAVSIGESEASGSLRGRPNSGGIATGTARVVGRLREIGRVNPGDILVCNATDPGWTPVFFIIAGIVTETGGLVSHASCLSREYGLPNIELPNAMQLIPDGATITVDGDLGVVVIHDQETDSDAQEQAESAAHTDELEVVGEPS